MSRNQFNRGATLLVDRDEKAQVATIELRAGERPSVDGLMRPRASISGPAWPCSTKSDWAATTI